MDKNSTEFYTARYVNIQPENPDSEIEQIVRRELEEIGIGSIIDELISDADHTADDLLAILNRELIINV